MQVIETLKKNYPHQTKYLDSVRDVYSDLEDFLDRNKEYREAGIPERLAEPDRIIQFRVTWLDEHDNVQVNRAWRVQHNNAVGPYKGGLRFHPTANEDTFKFLGFEQTLKNALTGFQLGGAKGGSDFDPKLYSDPDILRFCHALMMELYHYIGPDRDVPAGDIGVGEREIGYLYGAYKKLARRFDGGMTGKNPAFGGSVMRKEATGYGAVYFLERAMKEADETLEGQVCALSGAGNVALHTAEMLLKRGAKVISLSDSRGMIHIENGLTAQRLEDLVRIKTVERGTLEDHCQDFDDCTYYENRKPWQLAGEQPVTVAIPAATENEIGEDDARKLAGNKTGWVCEAANMPLTREARDILRSSWTKVLPGKAVNAGGVVVSGIERSQNAQYLDWPAEEVCDVLKQKMNEIHDLCLEYGTHQNNLDYVKGANIAGFDRVGRAMLYYGTL